MSYTLTEALCLTEDEKLVPDGHPEARWFYGPKGREIPDAEARKYGLLEEPAAAAAAPTQEPTAAPAAAKPDREPAADPPDPKPKKRPGKA